MNRSDSQLASGLVLALLGMWLIFRTVAAKDGRSIPDLMLGNKSTKLADNPLVGPGPNILGATGKTVTGHPLQGGNEALRVGQQLPPDFLKSLNNAFGSAVGGNAKLPGNPSNPTQPGTGGTNGLQRALNMLGI